MRVNDAHCHFFSARFFETLAAGMKQPPADPARAVPAAAGFDAPGTPEELAARWVAELDRHSVSRSALIASVPGDEESVAVAVRRYPGRFTGYFMLDPAREDAPDRARRALCEMGLRCVCLFPAMQRYSVQDERALRIFELAASIPGATVFVHCGVLSVGIRKKLGLPSPFDIRFGNPLDLHAVALRYPSLPIIIPHFGAGLLREALMLADLCPNVVLDTSSSNAWIRYHPGLTLAAVFRQALEVVGPDRLLFGTDSSFFPRGWQRSVYEAQVAALEEIGAAGDVRAKILGGNFDRLFVPSA